MPDLPIGDSLVALLLDGLNDEQRSAVTSVDGPVLVVAGPGSGKTRVLTTRIAYLIAERGVPPWNVLALTFTNKAAREMKERIERLVGGDRARWITMGTFHSFSARVLRQYGGEIGIDRRFVIYDDADQLGVVKSALQQLNIDPKQFSPRTILSAISGAKSRNLGPEEFADAVQTYWEEVVARVYPAYQEQLRRRNALDFDDLLSACHALLSTSEHARNQLRERFRYVLVDEYQDTNRLQYLIVRSLTEDHRNLCVVGDPDQSIYGWRAADIRNILSFKDDFPEAVEVHLEENYRSTPQILRAADGVIRENAQRIERVLRTSRAEGRPITRREALDEYFEARFIVEEIARLRSDEGYRGNDIAVLYRTNAQSRVIEELFIRAGIPYQLIGGTRFYERREIKDVIALLRLLANPDDMSAFERVLDAFPIGDGIGAKTLQTLDRWGQSRRLGLNTTLQRLGDPEGPPISGRARILLVNVRDTLARLRDLEHQLAVGDWFDETLSETGYESVYGAGDPELLDRWDNVLQLRALLTEFEGFDADTRLDAFLEEVALVSDADTLVEHRDRVTLITLHAVKGLEFKVVFIAGVEEGLIPHQRSITENPDMLEEERRLFYVGITRAEDLLYMTYAMRRSRYGMSDLALPSSFLNAIPEDVLAEPPLRPAPRANRVISTPAPTSYAAEFVRVSAGQRVFHARFGEGEVVEVLDKESDQDVTVEFTRHGRKRLSAALANLAPLED